MQISPPPERPAFARPRPPRLARAFALLWAAAVLVPLLGVAGAGVMSWYDVREEAVARLDRTVEMLRQHALRAFGTQEAILAAAARATDGLAWEEMRDREALHALLSDLAAAGAPVVRGVLVLDDTNRAVLASYEFPARPLDFSDRDYAQILREGGAERAIGQVTSSRPTGEPIFAIARPTSPSAEEAARPGLVVSSFDPEHFASFYASVTETSQDVVLLLRRDGAVLARHPPLAPGEEAPQRASLTAMLDRLLAPDAPREPIESVSPRDGGTRLFIARQVGDWPVAVAYGLSMQSMSAAWRHRMLAPALGGLAAAALLLALTGIAARGARRQQQEAESRSEAEAQLARAGRAAAIGLLAAGLAHDVKNLVQAVRSGARLMERRAEDPAEVRRCAALLADAAERGRRLVEAMLAFARGAESDEAAPPLEISRALTDLVELLSRTLGSAWPVKGVVPPGLPAARGDRAGFEAAVVNLAANARDAMPRGGSVTIAAWTEELAEPIEEIGLRAGRYVVVAVSDTGMGMDPATLARVGEPFFTTKERGRGTGLGLATVRGFCARAGGALRIDSEAGRGTTAAMWLPQA